MVAAMKDANWDIASHSLKWIEHRDMSEAEERWTALAVSIYFFTPNRPLEARIEGGSARLPAGQPDWGCYQ
jgi:hypothetical protein